MGHGRITRVLAALAVTAAALVGISTGASPAFAATATVLVTVASPTNGTLAEVGTSVTFTGTASVTSGSGSGSSSGPNTLTALGYTVDGGAPVAITNADITPDLPVTAPATVSYSTVVTGLTVGSRLVCVTATATKVGTPARTCVTVEVVQDLVNCAMQTCRLAANDRQVSTADFTGTGIAKLVGLRPGALGTNACGGLPCLTGYDVLWNGNPGEGVGELNVVAIRPDTAPGQAAVFLDGVEVTAKCVGSHDELPCQKINRNDSITVYTVRFDADPGVRFR